MRKAGEPRATAGEVNQDIGWFDVLVDEASLVHPPECHGERYCDAEELRRFQRSPGKPVERLAAGIFEHQHGATAVAHELKGARRPRSVQLILQFVFVGEAIEARARRALRGRQNDQDGSRAPSSCTRHARHKTRSPSSDKV